jgi:hypothetical protein
VPQIKIEDWIDLQMHVPGSQHLINARGRELAGAGGSQSGSGLHPRGFSSDLTHRPGVGGLGKQCLQSPKENQRTGFFYKIDTFPPQEEWFSVCSCIGKKRILQFTLFFATSSSHRPPLPRYRSIRRSFAKCPLSLRRRKCSRLYARWSGFFQIRQSIPMKSVQSPRDSPFFLVVCRPAHAYEPLSVLQTSSQPQVTSSRRGLSSRDRAGRWKMPRHCLQQRHSGLC